MIFESERIGQHTYAVVKIESLTVLFDCYDTDENGVYLQKGNEMIAMIQCHQADEFNDVLQQLSAIGVSPHKAECPF